MNPLPAAVSLTDPNLPAALYTIRGNLLMESAKIFLVQEECESLKLSITLR